MRRKIPPGAEPYRLSVDLSYGVICASGPSALVVDQASRLPGAKLWPGASGPYVSVPISREAFLALEALGCPESCSDEYVSIRSAAMAPDPQVVSVFLNRLIAAGGNPSSLLPYQVASCAQAIGNGRGLMNGSEQGTGKTRSTLAALAAFGAQKILVVAPKTVCIEWAKEAKKPTGIFSGNPPYYCVSYADGPIQWRAKEIASWLSSKDPVIVAINYESLPDLWDRLKKIISTDILDAVVADESHKMKSDSGKASRVFREIAMRVRYCFCVSGTPIGNDIGDIFPQSQAVAPGLLAPNYADFMSRYATFGRQDIYIKGNKTSIPVITGARDMQDLMTRLSPVWFRATKAGVLNLPPKQYNTIELDLSPNVRTLYEQVKQHGELVFDELSLSGALVRDLRLSQICGGFCPARTSDWNDPPETGPTLNELENPKFEWMKAFARDKLRDNPHHRVLIWCRFTATIMRTVRELQTVLGGTGRVTYITGGCQWTDEAIESFNSRNKAGVQVIVAQPKAVGMGKQMQAADSVIFPENSYSYIDRVQAEDRTHRLGRDDGVDFYDLVIRNSIDERVLEALTKKEDFATTIARGTTS